MKFKHILLLLLVNLIVSCTSDFEDMNIDKKNPASVTGESLFTNAQIQMNDQISSTDVNLNVWKLWAQYWTETTYTDEANYDIVNRTIADNTFRAFYRDVLKDFDEAAKIIAKYPDIYPGDDVIKANKLYIIDLLTVYIYQELVNTFGDIPYTEALNIENLSPVYDDAATIYNDLMKRVNAAIAGLDDSYGNFGNADLFYAGDADAWFKFANSLKLKLAINVADVPGKVGFDPKAEAEAAVKAGVFTSSNDDAKLIYDWAVPNTNTLYEDLVLSGRHDFVPTNTIVDIMNTLSDPRSDVYFDVKRDTSTEDGVEKLAYLGGEYGYSSPWSSYSHVGAPMHKPEYPGFVITYSEVQFYLAEAAERGWDVNGSAESFYNEGIKASIVNDWGLLIADYQTYIAKPEVAYATASGNWKEKIGTQAWLASYAKGMLGYTTWRRLDYPKFNVAELIDSYSEIPVRFTYPINEQTLNANNYYKAATAIGGDELTTLLFWDIAHGASIHK